MKKKFNNEHTPKSSEVCDKFSKSVSYETLVGGTSTIGSGIKQTRQLSKCSAVKPLTAVGTLTSLLCNSAKVVEKWLQMSPVFRLVEVLCLLVVLSVDMISESRAETCINSSSAQVSCIEKLADANGNNSCGDNCTYKVIEENGKQVLHIYKEDISKPAEIRQGAFSPKYYADNQVLDATGSVLPLNNIMLDNDFENIGYYAFAESGAQISSANGKFVINSPSYYFALGNNTTLNGDVYLKNLTGPALESSRINGDVIIMEGEKLHGFMFAGAYTNGNLIIPESVKSIENKYSFTPGLSRLNITGQIYCASGVEACYNLAKTACGTDKCLSKIDNMLASGMFRAYPDGCAKLEANLKCTKCKSASFKLEDDGWCLRKIYTPAEAAEVLKDDNNFVVITFKK